ncbi:MAG: nucleotide exchange factor GrpE [Anaerolineae bacterium]|nr:nucleotide exchange factor GrpE [Anaerolineae bacterium]
MAQLEGDVCAANRESSFQHDLANQRRTRLSEVESQLERLQTGFKALQQREAESNAQTQADAYLTLFDGLASLLVQLPTVEHAVRNGADIQAQDVLALLAPLHRVMDDIGFRQVGAPGVEVSFDSKLHSCSRTCQEGQPVRVKFVGYQYGDQILRRAQVE